MAGDGKGVLAMVRNSVLENLTVLGSLAFSMKTMRASSATSAENVSAVLATTLLWRTI
jgi:hypothetical protein